MSNIIKESYKQTRHDDDQNQPLSVQPWGKDSEKRAFYLIEGQDDTSFRVFREADRTQKAVWRSVAGSIEEIKDLATKLEKDSSISARQMAKSIHRTIPRFEATEEVRAGIISLAPAAANIMTEAETSGVQTTTTIALRTARAWLFALRRSDSRKTYALHL